MGSNPVSLSKTSSYTLKKLRVQEEQIIIDKHDGIRSYIKRLTVNNIENTQNQFETAKKEEQKPFVREEKLKAKPARPDELNILLNMDKTENEIVGGEPDEGKAPEKQKVKDYER